MMSRRAICKNGRVAQERHGLKFARESWVIAAARCLGLVFLGLAGVTSLAQESSQALTARAVAAYQEGRVQLAFTLANQAIQVAPADPTGYFIRGTVYESRGDYEKALLDYNQVIELSPSLPVAYSRRGGLRFKTRDFDGSIADFDQEIKIDPTKNNNHWQRGISYYYAQRYDDCRKQFELAYKTANPNDYENGIFQFLCVAKDQGIEKARKSMLPIEGDDRIPMKQIYNLLGGRGSVDEVEIAAETGNPTARELNDRLFYTHLYTGLYLDVIGEVTAARSRLTRAVENFPVAHYMWDVGRIHLEALPEVEAGSSPPPENAPAVPDRSQSQKRFRDPSPPKVKDAPNKEPPSPRPHPNVTFHAAPKPLSADAVTHDWTSFLGPTHNAVSTETRLLKKFPEQGPQLVWELEKGTSYTSPAIAGDRLVYLHRVGDKERVECLDPETGELYWQFEYGTDFSDRYGYNNGPRASPVIDDDRVYTYGAQGQLHALDLKTGELLWKREIASEFKIAQDFFGVANTPLIEGDLLIINVGVPGGPTVAAFDKRTGKMVWGAGEEWGASYASPIPAVVHGKRRIFTLAGGESRPPTGGLLSIDPATGKVDFQFPWRSTSYESVNASSPVIVDDRVFISASYETGSALLEMPAEGRRRIGWVNPHFGLHFTTAIQHEGYLYGFTGRNEGDASLACLDLKTGREKWSTVLEWKETVIANGQPREITESPFRGSLLKVDGAFLAIGEHGHLLWLDLSPEGYRMLSRTWLFNARETWALPVLSRGLLYVSQNTRSPLEDKPPRLLCYDLRAEE